MSDTINIIPLSEEEITDSTPDKIATLNLYQIGNTAS